MKLALLYLSIGTYVGAGLAFLIQIFLARFLSLEDFGAFSTALSLITLVAPLAGFGVGMFWLKVFGEEGVQALRWTKPSIKFTLISTVLILIITYLWAFFAPHSNLTRNIILILSPFIVSHVTIGLVSSIYQLEEKYINLAVWQFLPHALRFSFLIFILWTFSTQSLSVISVALIYLVVAVLMFLVGGKLVIKIYKGGLSLAGHASTLKKSEFNSQPDTISVLRGSWPFGLAGIFYFIYFHSSVILVSYTLGNEAAAQYKVVIVIMTAIYMFPSIVYQKLLLPKIHRWAHQDRKKLKQVYLKGNFLMLVLGVVTAGTALLIAPYVIPAAFGDKYTDAMFILSIWAFAIPIRFIATSVGSMLTTGSHMIRKVKYMGAVAFANVLLSLLFIELIGINGVAYAVLVSDGMLLLLYYYSVNRFVFKKAV
jgi:O-antigen/teichoic acid export membrane protein